MFVTNLSTLSFAPLRERLSGTLALPDEPDYARLATPWNVAVRTTPAAVVDAGGPEDVVEAIRFAGAAGLAVAVQATGHGIAADLDGALLVHTGRLDECVVHPEGWARVGAGVRWQQVIEAAAPHGLAPLCGSSPNVGVVGYTTGGGLGPMARTFGMTSDHVRAIEVVTGDGALRRATATENADLFWGLRGGKGALGVVTAMELDLVPLSEVYGGALYFDGTDAATVLHAWRDWCADLPEQGTTSIALLQLPPIPGVPEPLAGRLTVAVRFVWTGEPAEGERLLTPIRDCAAPLIDAVGPMPYTAIGMVHSDPVDPMPAHEAGDLLSDLPPAAVDALLAVTGPGSGSPQTVVEVRQLGGAVARGAATPDAMCHRDAAFTLLAIGVPVPPMGDAVVAHAAQVREAIAPWATGGQLPNFQCGTGAERLARSYDEPTLSRLVAIAERYDPNRVLRVGQVPVR
jgi:hypothetical protein